MMPPTSPAPVSLSGAGVPSPALRRAHLGPWQAARVRRWYATIGGMLLLTCVTVLLALLFGAHKLSWTEVWSALSSGGTADADVTRVILWEVRFPRVMMGLLVGAALAVTGTVLQALVRNPLADPYVLGIASGAALGASIGLALGLGSAWGGVGLQFCAFVGGGLSFILVYGIAAARGPLSVHTLLLAGVILNAVCSALMMFATSIVNPASLYRIVVWMMGTLSAPDAAALVTVALVVTTAVAVLLLQSNAMNLLAAGEDASRSLGLETHRLQTTVFMVSALLTGLVVSLCGMIGFVGMVVPHVLRMMCGADHRLLLPASALGGGILLVLADTIARTVVAPAEIPVGVVTALIGGPFFLYLLMSRTYRFST